MGPTSTLRTFATVLVAPKTIAVVMTLYLMSLYEVFLRKSGALGRLMQNFLLMLGDKRVTGALMPAVLGLPPSPGGARFSAPLVAETMRDEEIDVNTKAFVNYWFRHIWEPIMPLYPATLMAALLIGISPGQLFVLNWYVPLAMIAAGWLIAFGFSKPSLSFRKPAWREMALDLGPLLLVILLGIAIRKDFTVPIAILAACSFIFARTHRTLPHPLGLFKEALKWKMLAIIPAVYFFASMLEATGADKAVAQTLSSLNLPPVLFFITLPFVISAITGITQAGVGTAIPLLAALTNSANRIPLLNLAFVFAVAGVMASPTHLCLILSREYFKAKAAPLYKKVLFAIIITFAVPLALFLF